MVGVGRDNKFGSISGSGDAARDGQMDNSCVVITTGG